MKVAREHVIHTRFNCMWMAFFDNYDGALDGKHPIGTGKTELAAITDLLEQDEERSFATNPNEGSK